MGRKKITTQMWVLQAQKTHGEKYGYAKAEYTGYQREVTIRCFKHGDFQQLENNHRNGAGCPKCGVESRAKSRSISWDQFTKKAASVHKNKYEYPPQPFTNSRDDVVIKCPEHGVFLQKAYTHLAGTGCKPCGYSSHPKDNRLTITDFINRAQAIHGNKYEYLYGYESMHKKMRIRCDTHGAFDQTPSNHLKGAGCPKCTGGVSKPEQELFDFVSKIDPSAIQSDRSIISPLELDIVVPSKKIAIEFNGLWYHREELVGTKTKDKWEKCREAGFTLIQIYEDEWRDNQEAVKMRVEALLGASATIFARKCTTELIGRAEARRFLEINHSQGAGTALNRVYGLRLKGELVAVASFGHGRFKNNGWELMRYCSKGRVQGGISKLVKHFSKNHTGPLIAYADLRWGNGMGYGAAGFTLVGQTEPDYWWVNPQTATRIPRYNVQPHKTGMPEKNYAKSKGYYKVTGVGHLKWEFNM